MKKPVFAVRDSAVAAFMNPFVAPSQGAALRSFMDEVNRSGSEMNRHPKDYELWRVGEWDDASASFSRSETEPEQVSRAVDVFELEGDQTGLVHR